MGCSGPAGGWKDKWNGCVRARKPVVAVNGRLSGEGVEGSGGGGCQHVSWQTRARAWWADALWWSGDAVFHESLVRVSGGERRYIFAAVSRSRIIMGPPHWGQGHEEVEGNGIDEPSPSSGGSSGVGGKLVGRPRN